ncbi:DUF262 domain-containing protein [Agrobacterium pusense]|uniref:DUF262 domain-containing protein n=1 Tax=Agrobacterium pusense TaxID=648995 RepID=UPI001C6E6452|nr:DUF262 domain-containing protein [Agrobacterium pusense]MBW9069842.1 DUF262 domain-containing protein [Agrobacterium pusense]MBW9084919.1 DUF262 domain-containing protein [Agrobacterium pusense]MBW9125606.1 DUF262 domain-containing protein [Agrobacterium pusense]MBW9138021.1 DUF262 domain-containing protein [Agrobacterium pusense]
MYKPGGTIKSLLDKIANQDYVLPAIQREFVWWPDQVCELFDSLMQGYPFGTFLFWKIEQERRTEYKFYDFVRHYHQRDRFHCEFLQNPPNRELTAVLDGQQRMTALNVGLRGSYAWKMPGKRWSTDAAFPVRYLYLDLLSELDTETGCRYHFEFLTEQQSIKPESGEVWFRCGRVMEEEYDDLIDSLDDLSLDKEAVKTARATLRLFHKTIHDKDLITYYEEESQSLEHVLNIFIRMNNGGTPLSYSDLLLSVAVAQWEKVDAREAIHSLVDEMNKEGDGFKFTKDLALKAGLMLSDIGSVGFKVENFNKTNMAILEANWPRIHDAMLLAVQLLASFGFSSQNLRAESSILPIAYYLYARNLDGAYLHRAEFAADREGIRRWLVRSILKASGIWGSGLDTLLTALREKISAYAPSGFPVAELEAVMALRGKSLSFTDVEIDELCDLSYGDGRTFALLSLIFPGFDLSRHFHVDHIFPQGRFSTAQLRKAGVRHDLWGALQDKHNRLPNLQLLEGSINSQKRQKMPHEWYAWIKPDEVARQQYLAGLEIASLPEDLNAFPEFYDQRRKALKARIIVALNQNG